MPKAFFTVYSGRACSASGKSDSCWPPVRREAFASSPEDLRLPSEQVRFAYRLVTGDTTTSATTHCTISGRRRPSSPSRAGPYAVCRQCPPATSSSTAHRPVRALPARRPNMAWPERKRRHRSAPRQARRLDARHRLALSLRASPPEPLVLPGPMARSAAQWPDAAVAQRQGC